MNCPLFKPEMIKLRDAPVTAQGPEADLQRTLSMPESSLSPLDVSVVPVGPEIVTQT